MSLYGILKTSLLYRNRYGVFLQKNKIMNLDERMGQSRTYSSFRTSLDIGMGAIYVVIGVVVFTMRYFGAIELSKTTGYVLGGLMVLYGLFRIYRGAAVMLEKKRPTNRNAPNADI